MITDTQALLQSWSAPIGVNVFLSLAALVYARGWFRLHSAVPKLLPAWRLAAFLAGVVSVWIAIGSPVEAFDDVSLTVHMVQHLLLMSVAPPLILLGAPALPLLRGLPQSIAREVAGPFLRWRLVKWLGRALAHPAICWLAAAFALIGWHVPAIFDLALRWDWLHELEHATFLGTGLLFWWPVIQPWPSSARWPRWSIPLYLFGATLPCDVLSAFLAFCNRVVYSSYLSGPSVFGLSALEDQECAAALMWTCVTFIFLIPAVVVTMQILSPQETPVPDSNSDELRGVPPQPLTSKLEVI
ncbi:MAG TPA: cytochrome c oxidase assembly protein [Candidatus Sulfotelmatobacter sp.]|nr:cytochrome c oxidase assembly protein [Candidatus Sulfotelmatobacter sp.]